MAAPAIPPSSALPMVKASARAAKLIRAFRNAQMANPRNGGLYAGSLTIADRQAVAPTEATKVYTYAGDNSGVFRVSGGTPVLINSYYRFYASVVSPNGGNLGTSNGRSGITWRATVLMNARYLAVRLFPSALPYRFMVDGRYVSLAGTTLINTTGSTGQYLLLDFATRGIRQVTLEGQLAQGFISASCEATGTLEAPDFSSVPNIACLADSYHVGTAAAVLGDGMIPVMGDWLGGRVLSSGSSGTGLTTAGPAYRFDERVVNGDLALGVNPPDLIVLGGSINDRAGSLATITANATTQYAAARSQFPGVPIMVYGVFAGSTGPSNNPGVSDVIGAENAVKAAVTALADPLTSFIPVSTDPTGPWISGTGRIGTTTGVGNGDWATANDASPYVHLSDEGCAYAGRRLAKSIADRLTAIYPNYA